MGLCVSEDYAEWVGEDRDFEKAGIEIRRVKIGLPSSRKSDAAQGVVTVHKKLCFCSDGVLWYCGSEHMCLCGFVGMARIRIFSCIKG